MIAGLLLGFIVGLLLGGIGGVCGLLMLISYWFGDR